MKSRCPGFLVALGLALLPCTAWAIGQTRYVETINGRGYFPLVQGKDAARLYVDLADWPGVIRTIRDLQADIRRVTDLSPTIVNDDQALARNIVIIGTIGKSALVDRLIREKKIDAGQIAGKWESFLVQTVTDPLPGVASALVIAGSDKRGTIYGIYDLSEQIGVSPWYWWADVTPDRKDSLFIRPGKYQEGEPSVKYRGIFFNDEKPDLTNWVREKFGEVLRLNGDPANRGDYIAHFNHEFYTKAFELILRLKGNYLWPAMWNNAFNEDDPENARLADEYGIVMGTSHQEPMLRAQKEWDWRYRTSWNYANDPQTLESFWREGITRNKNFESILTIGLRGANDTPMAPGGPAANRTLLEKIVETQRKMIADVLNPDVTKVPQLWALYKEVQDFYEAGMRVPDDVTLLWAEDNWGNVRRLPTADERKRSGGAGVYYHFDYHGGPRNYQWVNTSPIAKIWDQMSLAKQYGADRIWIVNVGHFKGYELPLEYFMSLAWKTDRWTNENINEFTRLWAEREFGSKYSEETADILAKYSKYNGRRKPEMLDALLYSPIHYREAETVVADYDALAAKAQRIYDGLPESKRDAFYQLVLFPAKASANLNAMYLAVQKNALYAQQGRASTNDMATQVRSLFKVDGDLMTHFNKTFANGKWDHFMDQFHIGFTSWNEPPDGINIMPRVREIEVPATAAMGVAVEGSEPALPKFDAFNQQKYFIDVFNKGQAAFVFTATSSEPWILLSETGGTVEKDKRLWVSVDWSKAPKGSAGGSVKISGANSDVSVKVDALNPTELTRTSLRGFVEGQGFVSIEPEHYSKKNDAGPNRWIRIEDYGRTLSGMRAASPIDAPSDTAGRNSPSLEYQMYVFNSGQVSTNLILAPSLNFSPDRGVSIAVSFDDEAPQIKTVIPQGYKAQNGNRDWEKTAADNARLVSTTHTLAKPGYHTLKIWMVDPGVLVQKIVVDTGGLKASYLGPPESYRR